MSKFSGRFILEPDEDERTAFIHEQFEYFSDRLGRRIVIPKGFQTDGASVPRIFWNIIPPWGQYGKAAVVHDYLYRWQKFTQRESDDVLLEAMWVCHVSYVKQGLIYSAVRIFGAHAWAQDKKKPLSAQELAVNN